MTYALSALAGQLSLTVLRRWHDVFARKTKRRGRAKTLPTTQQTIDSYDKSSIKYFTGFFTLFTSFIIPGTF